MIMKHWWDDDRGKPKYRNKNIFKSHFVHRKSQTDWRGTKREPSGWENSDKPPEQLRALKWSPSLSASKLKPTFNCDFP
jgi:hypothetical protein